MNFFAKIVDFVKKNPKITSIVASGAAMIGLPFLVSGAVLGILGFGACGIVGGSIAASIHSAIGPTIAAHGIFATLTSAGAGGYGAAIINGLIMAGGTTLVGGGGLRSIFCSLKEKTNNSIDNLDRADSARDITDLTE